MALAQAPGPEPVREPAERSARYDLDTDTFFLELVHSAKSVTRSGVYPEVYVHYDLTSGEPVALTVLAFWESFAQQHPAEARELLTAAPQIEVVGNPNFNEARKRLVHLLGPR